MTNEDLKLFLSGPRHGVITKISSMTGIWETCKCGFSGGVTDMQKHLNPPVKVVSSSDMLKELEAEIELFREQNKNSRMGEAMIEDNKILTLIRSKHEKIKEKT